MQYVCIEVLLVESFAQNMLLQAALLECIRKLMCVYNCIYICTYDVFYIVFIVLSCDYFVRNYEICEHICIYVRV